VKAHAWLAEAFQKAGNTQRACEVSAAILQRWGGSSSSTSAREAKARMTALKCAAR
jgi:hypothetical protein